MSIQQTINQGLAVAAALGTQTPQYQAKVAKRKTEMEYKTLGEEIDKAASAATERKEEDETPEAFDKVATLLEKQNLIRPNTETAADAEIWRGFARDLRKQKEAQARMEAQKQAAEEQRKEIGKMIMRV